MKTKQLLAAALSAATLLASLPAALAADGDAPASRGAVCAALLAAADDYNPDVTAADIMHGDLSVRGDSIFSSILPHR